jgi:hypothetical protein
MSVLNRKLGSLSANTTSNRDNAQKLDAPDMFNWLGDKVALELLENDPEVARTLLLNVVEERQILEKERDSRLMYRMTGRLPMLPTALQEEVYTRLEETFKTQLLQLEQAGETPFKTREFDIRARVVHEETLEEGVDPTNPFDAPLVLREIEYQARMRSITHADAIEHLQRVRDRGRVGSRFPFLDYATEIREAIDARERTELRVSKQFETVQAALASNTPNIFKRYDQQRRFLAAIENELQYGVSVNLPIAVGMNEWREIPAWFLGVNPPRQGRMECYGDYDLRFLTLDQEFYGTVTTTLSSLMTHWAQTGTLLVAAGRTPLQTAQAQFANRQAGTVTQRRLVLGGNLLRAVEVSQIRKEGSTAVYTNEHGERMRGVVMPAGVRREELITDRLVIPSAELAFRALVEFNTPINARARAARLNVSPLFNADIRRYQGYTISVTGDERYVTRRAIRDLGFDWETTHEAIKGTRRRLTVNVVRHVTEERVRDFVLAAHVTSHVRWSTQATNDRRQIVQRWIADMRGQEPLVAGLER